MLLCLVYLADVTIARSAGLLCRPLRIVFLLLVKKHTPTDEVTVLSEEPGISWLPWEPTFRVSKLEPAQSPTGVKATAVSSKTEVFRP